MTHSQIKQYCLDRLSEAKPLIINGTPWGFVCLATFVDFLTKLALNKDSTGSDYINFFKQFAPPQYSSFAFAGGETDLPEQLWYVFRCGICHSFSLAPDKRGAGKGGRPKSLVISHDGKDDDGTEYHHLQNYTNKGYDAAVLLGGTLCDDLVQIVCDMFNDTNVQTNAEAWVKDHPPIKGI